MRLKVSIAAALFLAAGVGVAQETNFTPADIYVATISVVANPFYDMGKPDVMIKNSDETAFIGNDTYNDDGQSQTKEQWVRPESTAVYHLRVQNDADFQRLPDNITVRGDSSYEGFIVAYYSSLTGVEDITDDVIATGWSTGALEFGDYVQIRVEVTVTHDAWPGGNYAVLVTAQSNNEPNQDDAVKAVTHNDYDNVVTESPGPSAYLETRPASSGGFEIRYGLPYTQEARLAVYDAIGREVELLVSGEVSEGSHSFRWSGADLPGGVYFVRFTAGLSSATAKLLLVR